MHKQLADFENQEQIMPVVTYRVRKIKDTTLSRVEKEFVLNYALRLDYFSIIKNGELKTFQT